MQGFTRMLVDLKRWAFFPLKLEFLKTIALALLLFNTTSWAQLSNNAGTKNIFVSNTSISSLFAISLLI
jgi:hypothetical protein